MDSVMRDQNVDRDLLVEAIGDAERSVKRAKQWILDGVELALGTPGEHLASTQLELVRLRYSLGVDLDVLEQDLREAVHTMLEYGWENALRGHQRMYEALGIVQLFGCEDLEQPLWWMLKPTAGPIEYYITGNRRWVTEGEPILQGQDMPQWCAFIDSVADADPADAALIIQDYVENRWYDSWASGPGWNTHEQPAFGYVGYWAFEIAALAKLNKVDDSALEGHRYYPYDLAHYAEI